MVGIMNLHRMAESTVGLFPLGRSQNMQYDLALYPGWVGGEKRFLIPPGLGLRLSTTKGGC